MKIENFWDLKGHTLKTAKIADGDRVVLETSEWYCTLQYYQDCCAHCRIVDVVGDLSDLVGSPLLLAEEVEGDTPEKEILEDGEPIETVDSYTWTFYKLATVKGHVTITYLGESNGYYSETATFEARPTSNDS